MEWRFQNINCKYMIRNILKIIRLTCLLLCGFILCVYFNFRFRATNCTFFINQTVRNLYKSVLFLGTVYYVEVQCISVLFFLPFGFQYLVSNRDIAASEFPKVSFSFTTCVMNVFPLYDSSPNVSRLNMALLEAQKKNINFTYNFRVNFSYN